MSGTLDNRHLPPLDDLIEALRQGNLRESEQVIFKQQPKLQESRQQNRKIYEAIAELLVALGNTSGGYIFFGVDESGTIEGLSDQKATADAVLHASREVVRPLILVGIREGIIDGKPVTIVTVPESDQDVFQVEGKYLWRKGSFIVPLSVHDLRDLFARRTLITYEMQPVADARYEDLDPAKVEAYIRRRGDTKLQSLDAVLRERGCILGEDRRPTVAGILLFGKDPQRFFDHSNIQLTRFPGTEIERRYLDSRILNGTIPELIDQAVTYIWEHTLHGGATGRLIRESIDQYPEGALREAIANAVAHRDYSIRGSRVRIMMFSNRIEVSSPGRLPLGITVRNMVREQFARNTRIVRVLYELGYVEEQGIGIDNLLRDMREAGLPEPRFEENAASFVLTLYGYDPERFARKQEKLSSLGNWRTYGLNHRQQRILEQLAQRGQITRVECESLFPEVTDRAIRKDLAELVARGLVRKIGETRGAYYVLADV